MTTQKVQSKIKSSTIAITVLSILLAVAVASTIVLAAFSATRQANTTITFGGGLTLELSSTSSNGFTVTGGTGDAALLLTPDEVFSGAITIPAISGKLNMDGFVSFKISVFQRASSSAQWGNALAISDNTATAGNATVTITPSTNVTAGTNGLYYYDVAEASPKAKGELAKDAVVELINSITITADDYNEVKNNQIAVIVQFYAESKAGNGTQNNVKDHSFNTATPA